MGLTSSSTGSGISKKNPSNNIDDYDYIIGLAGNPNVGKSTVFNNLTGMHQHTGNWPGKTVSNAVGICKHQQKNYLFVDIPGTYSLMSNSEEEEIARDYICFGNADLIIVVVDATCLERNLNLVYQTLEITKNVIVCVNLLDEAKKKGIHIDLTLLSHYLGVPVVGTIARKKSSLINLLDTIHDVCEGIIKTNPKIVEYSKTVESSIQSLVPEIERQTITNNRNVQDIYLNRWIALKLLDGDETLLHSIYNSLQLNENQISRFKEKIERVNKKLEKEDISTNQFRDHIVSTILEKAEIICNKVSTYKKENYHEGDRKIDKILTSKTFGIPIMILFFGIIFWLTITGANYPSELLSKFFNFLQEKLYLLFESLNAPTWVSGILIDGMYQTLSWVISVMLPPMAIFFPLFTILEDLGYLPRIAFNLDHYFKKACSSGKQALTMCMGFGCNAAGVIGCRIINSPRERLIAIITNAFVPCNGRFPFLITVASIFIGGIGISFGASFLATICVLFIILLGIFLTLIISKILSKTLLKGVPSVFTLELPPYRKPQIGKILIRSIFDRTLYVLGRAIITAAPAGIVIWILANIGISDISLLQYLANFLNPFASLMGLDGYILTAFILGIPANEIVLPIILMCYLGVGSMINLEDTIQIKTILIENGWTLLTAVNVMLFTLLHFPCATTLLTIKKETNSIKWTLYSFLIPTVCGIFLCMSTTFIWNLFALI